MNIQDYFITREEYELLLADFFKSVDQNYNNNPVSHHINEDRIISGEEK